MQLKEILVTSSWPLLFIIFSIKSDWVQRKLSSHSFLIILFKNTLFSRVSCRHWLFWLFTKIKKWYRIIFWCTFSTYLFHENGLYLQNAPSFLMVLWEFSPFSSNSTKWSNTFSKTLKYWVGVQQGQSYLMGRRCLFSLGWPSF